MADESTGTGAPAATTTEPQAGASTTSDPKPQAGAPTVPATDGMSLETKKKLDKENLQLRRERDEFAKKLQEFENAKLSETERLTKRLKELEDREATWLVEKRERDTRDAVIEAASDEKVGARNPRAVYRLIKDDLEFDESGKVQNLKAAIEKAKADFPELFGKAAGGGAGSVNGGAGGRGNAPPQDMNAVLRAKLQGHA